MATTTIIFKNGNKFYSMNWDNAADASLYGAYYTSEKAKQERQKRELGPSVSETDNTWSYVIKQSIKYDYTRPIAWGVMLSTALVLFVTFLYTFVSDVL